MGKLTAVQRVVQLMEVYTHPVSRPELARMLGVEVKAVEQAVRQLEEMNLMRRVGLKPSADQKGGGGGRPMVLFRLVDGPIDKELLKDGRGRPRSNRTLIERASDAAQGVVERSGLDMWLFGRVAG